MPITYVTIHIDGGLDCSSLSIGILKSIPELANHEGDGHRRTASAPHLGVGSSCAGYILLQPVREVSLSSQTSADTGKYHGFTNQ